MPVRLNTIPDAEPYPVPPARIKWLTALLLMLSVGVALTSLFASDELAKNGPYFWGLACGVPAFIWSLVASVRWLFFITQYIRTDAWNKRREEVILQETRRGRRALQILSFSVQTALTPLALLHRPECITDTEMMASGIAQALDWMPVQPDAISGMWTAELDREQRAALLSLNQPFAQEALMYELDAFLGRSGPAAPWLSVAVATLAAIQSQHPQLTLSGVQGGHYSWATVVSPFVSPQEAS
ncbi:TPA: hypothetical protein N2470_003365 [Escherichia coli]|nr:hypothetical protein [Escherichia coli]HCM0086718.1 hypothetical protein [Escherichia coli]